ncbi:MAG TPA: hypothetical protein VK168_01865, partial [Saprospiraceae bacterium]|nr:hypothetical protein [Saprospiraceae bacterium]
RVFECLGVRVFELAFGLVARKAISGLGDSQNRYQAARQLKHSNTQTLEHSKSVRLEFSPAERFFCGLNLRVFAYFAVHNMMHEKTINYKWRIVCAVYSAVRTFGSSVCRT